MSTSGMHRRPFEGRHLVWKVFESTFEIDSVCTAIFKQIAGLSFYPEFLMLYIKGFVSQFYKLMESFFF